MFETDRGAIGSVVISQVSPGRKNRLWLSLDGADEALAFDQEHPDCLWIGTREEARTIARGTAPTQSQAPPGPHRDLLPPGHPEGYHDAFTAFVAATYAAAAGHPPDGLPTFADGVRAAGVTAAVLRSAGSGAWEAVP
jgi:predicted dehydrogenase